MRLSARSPCCGSLRAPAGARPARAISARLPGGCPVESFGRDIGAVGPGDGTSIQKELPELGDSPLSMLSVFTTYVVESYP